MSNSFDVLIEIVRSPARITWLVNVNGQTVGTADTKIDAQVVAADYAYLATKAGHNVFTNEA